MNTADQFCFGCRFLGIGLYERCPYVRRADAKLRERLYHPQHNHRALTDRTTAFVFRRLVIYLNDVFYPFDRTRAQWRRQIGHVFYVFTAAHFGVDSTHHHCHRPAGHGHFLEDIITVLRWKRFDPFYERCDDARQPLLINHLLNISRHVFSQCYS